MAFQAEQSVIATHASTVIGHSDEAAPPGHDFDGNMSGLSVQGILNQFLLPRWQGVRPLPRRQFDLPPVQAKDGYDSRFLALSG
jgi:hypothetical protein